MRSSFVLGNGRVNTLGLFVSHFYSYLEIGENSSPARLKHMSGMIRVNSCLAGRTNCFGEKGKLGDKRKSERRVDMSSGSQESCSQVGGVQARGLWCHAGGGRGVEAEKEIEGGVDSEVCVYVCVCETEVQRQAICSGGVE